MVVARAVVVDASLVFKWIVKEEDLALADDLAGQWFAEQGPVLAPSLLLFELTNALYQQIRSGDLDIDGAEMAIDRIRTLPVQFVESEHLTRRPLELTSLLGQGAIYDSLYLALAESLECDLWTADGRFYRAAEPHTNHIQQLDPM